MTDPYYTDDHVTLYHGDALELLPDLDADTMITDPPYGIEWNSRGLPGATAYRDLEGDTSTALAEWCINYWAPCPMIVFGANHFPNALTGPGRWLCWDKRISAKADRMIGSPFELAWQNTDTDKAGLMFRVLHGGVYDADAMRPARRSHPTQKPAVLFRQILDRLVDPADIIVDPFAGSGPTLRAAKDLDRRAIGIEIDERYCEVAARKCSQEVLPV